MHGSRAGKIFTDPPPIGPKLVFTRNSPEPGTARPFTLRSGVDLMTIGHWLGHASVETTNRCAAVDLETHRKSSSKGRDL